MSNETPQSPDDGTERVEGEQFDDDATSARAGESAERAESVDFSDADETGAPLDEPDEPAFEPDDEPAFEPDDEPAAPAVTEPAATAATAETTAFGEPVAEPRRIDEVPTDIGEPEPAIQGADTSTGAGGATGAAASGAAVGAAVTQPGAAAPYATTPPGAQPTPGPIYVTAPVPPKAKGNRLMGILIAVVAAVVFALVSAVVVLGIFELQNPGHSLALWERYLPSPAFWVPIIVFFLAYALLIAIVNRGGWWAYVLGSFFVGVIVYFGYIGGALLTVHVWALTIDQAEQFIGTLWTGPLTITAAIVAREACLWFGAWIAARGRRVRARNLEAQREYDRTMEGSAF